MNDLPLSAADLEFMGHYPPRLVPEWGNLVAQAHAAIGLKQEVQALLRMVLDSYVWWDEASRRFGCHHCTAIWPATQPKWHAIGCPIPPIQAAQAQAKGTPPEGP